MDKRERTVWIRRALRDGLPICLGYLAASFSFGIVAVGAGLSIWEAVLVSMMNLTSAGQLASIPVFAGIESVGSLALTQLVINLRYSLMAIGISQKFDKDVRTRDKFLIAYACTDEVFGVECAADGKLPRVYLFAIIPLPFLGWTLGTLLGAVAGNLLPAIVVSSLSITIYAMFISIVTPVGRERRPVALCALLAVALACLFRYVPGLSSVPDGFVIIIAALVCGALFALLSPLPDEEEEGAK